MSITTMFCDDCRKPCRQNVTYGLLFVDFILCRECADRRYKEIVRQRDSEMNTKPRLAEVFLEKTGETRQTVFLAGIIEIGEQLGEANKRVQELEAENSRLREAVGRLDEMIESEVEQ